MRTLIIVIAVTLASCVFAQHPSYDPRYHTVAEVIEEITALADTYSAYCHLESLGHTGVDSITIWGMRISDNPTADEDETCIEFHGGQHADEPAGVEVCMWMINDLLHRIDAGDSIAVKWWEDYEIWIIPQMNCDGRIMCLDSGYTEWRKTKRDLDSSGTYDAYTDGVDPNRNWDYMWEDYTATDLDNTKGPYPFSEQCVITMRDFFIRERPLYIVDYHSPDSCGGNKLWICWWFSEGPYTGWGPDAQNNWREIRDDLAAAILDETGEPYEGAASYHTKPKLQTWTYYELGSCSIVMEITNQCFWHGDTIDTIAARVGRGSYYLMERAAERMLITHVVDSATGEPITNAIVEVVELQHDYFPPRVVDPVHGTNRRLLERGYYSLYVNSIGYFAKEIDSIYIPDDGPPVEITVELARDLGVDEVEAPMGFELAVSPNPFNDAVSIDIRGVGATDRSQGQVGLKIFDINGRLVADLPFGRAESGRNLEYSRNIGADSARLPTPLIWIPDKTVGSGVYLIEVSTGTHSISKKVVYIR